MNDLPPSLPGETAEPGEVGWDEQLFQLASYLLGALEAPSEARGREPDDLQYYNSVVEDFEKLIDGLRDVSRKHGVDTDAPKIKEADELEPHRRVDETRRAAVEVIGVILKNLEYRWGLVDALSPLKFLKLAMQDLIEGYDPPLFAPKERGRGRRGALDAEFLRHVRYLSALVVEARRGIGDKQETAASKWASALAYEKVRHPYAGALISSSMVENWSRDLADDTRFCNDLRRLMNFKEWPKSASTIATFEGRVQRFVVNMYRRTQFLG